MRTLSLFNTRLWGEDPEPSEADNKDGVLMTQEQIDHIVQKRVAKKDQELKDIKEKNQSMHQQLESLRESKSLTQKQKEEIAKQMSDLEKTFLTEQEQAAKKEKEIQQSFEKEKTQIQTERDLWQQRYTSAEINRELLSAAASTGAENELQIVQMFTGATRLVETTDDSGKPTGSFQSVTKILGKNEEGTVVEMELPTSEAITRLKTDGLNKNLFKHNQNHGTGSRVENTGGVKSTEMPDPNDYGSPEEFQKAYQAYRNGDTK